MVYWAAVAALALPLAAIVVASFSAPAFVGFPPGPFSARWYGAALADPAVWRAFALSVALAGGSAALAVFSGGWIALAAVAIGSRRWRMAFLAAAVVPLVTPGLVHAIALRMASETIGLPPGVTAMLLGHAIHAAPYAAIMVGARLATLPAGLGDAARDLGAGEAAVFRHVVLPWLLPALLGAGALSALTSFDDFIRSFFLGGYDVTLPVLIFARLRGGVTPEIDAVASLMLLGGLAIGLVVEGYRASPVCSNSGTN